MTDQADAGAIATATRTRVPGGLRGITGKLAAIIAALLAVFVVAATALVYQVVDLASPDADTEAIGAGHRTSQRVLLEFKEQLDEFHQMLIAGSDGVLRRGHAATFAANQDLVDSLLVETVGELPPGIFRDAAKRFQEAHTQMRAPFEQAIADFERGNGKNVAAAAQSVNGVDVQAFTVFEDATNAMEKEFDRRDAEQVTVIDERVAVIVGLGVILLLALVVASVLVVRRVVRPIRTLTDTAERISRHDLPEAVATVLTLPDGEQPPVLEPIAVGSRDETAQLADAFHSLQTSALSLAVQQHRAEQESSQMLVNLGRRNQNLLNRTLAYITELERTEQDPDVLDRLFRLDHATTRIRRNAESMLVLAGAQQTRTWTVPAPAADVVRAALTEIEDYNRVDVYHVQDAAVVGSAIADVVHLLAELMENATVFSPPRTKVTVVGQAVPEGYRIRIIDEGIGMTRGELEASNRTIRVAGEGRSASKLLGLYVVGRLAARRGIEVTLEASGGRGVTANVVLPRELIAEMPPAPAAPIEPPVAVDQAPSRPMPSAAPVLTAPPIHRAPAHAVAPVHMAPVPSTPPVLGAPAIPPAPQPAPRPAAQAQAPVRRVPGAQLPDLGPAVQDGPELGTLDASHVRGRLSALQAGVRAGRQADLTANLPEVAADDTAGIPLGLPTSGTSAPAHRTEPELTVVPDLVEEPALDHAVAEAAEDTGVAEVVEVPVEEPAEVVVELPVEETPPARPAVPVRVPGAQLPDLGLMSDRPDTYLAPPSMASRWALRSFQLDVDAARRLDPLEPLDTVDGRTAEGNGGTDGTQPTRRPGRTLEES